MTTTYQLPVEPIEQIIAERYADQFAGVHEAANLFPLPTADEFAELCASIAEDGIEDPIIREGASRLLVDGRSRLLACHVAGRPIKVIDDPRTGPLDMYQLSLRKNLKRRNITTGQKAMAVAKYSEVFEIEAHSRKKSAGGDRKSEAYRSLRVNSCEPIEDTGRTNEKLATIANVGSQAIDRARDLHRYAPDQAKAVETGEMTLNAAYTEAKPAIREAKIIAKQGTEAKPREQTVVIRVDGSTYPIDKPARPVFNTTNDSVGWAKFTWNPVTGCLHGCEFCYAREIATSTRMAPFYPLGFEPVLHEYRLSAPANTTYPKELTKPEDGRVFVCSMADLFGKWVPDAWIRNVFDAAMDSPQWEYLFLTKWPRRYKLLASLPKAWFGASIIRQVDVKRVERDMAAFETSGIKWCSLEPMLEPIRFNDLSWCDLMVIGSQTATTQPEIGHVPASPAHFEWVADVVAQCRAAGVPYYLKTNLETAPGMTLPRQAPRKTA